jgi:ribosomal protein L11 methyltransferase
MAGGSSILMFELRLHCPQDQVEVISEALLALDSLSVSVEDADAHTDQEHALFGEPGMPAPEQAWLRSHLIALFADQLAAEQAAQLLQLQDFFDQASVVRIAEVPSQDWVRLTQSQFEPVEITSDLWVVPTWHEAPAQARKVIRLDPGLAFGTGTHPTTRMCLRWIAQHGVQDER